MRRSGLPPRLKVQQAPARNGRIRPLKDENPHEHRLDHLRTLCPDPDWRDAAIASRTPEQPSPQALDNGSAAESQRTLKAPLEDRLNEIEIKISYNEDLLDELNRTVFRQQQQIDALIAEMRTLRDQVRTAEPGEPRNLRDEIPPHY